MPAPLVIAGGVAASVSIEYGFRKLQGEKATTKQLVTAAVFGALPIAKLKLLKVPYRAVKYRSYRVANDMRHLVPFGTRVIKRPFTVDLGRASPYVGAAFIGAPAINYGTGRLKRRLFSHGYDFVAQSRGDQHTASSGRSIGRVSPRRPLASQAKRRYRSS